MAEREILSSGRTLIIGEVAQAHDGSLGTAHAFIDAIARAGADAVKFQTHIAEAESSPGEPWRVKFSRQDATRFEYWKRMEFTEAQWHGLKAHADERGLLFLSSPFSFEAIELLERVGVPAWKVASGEVGNAPMLDRLIDTKKPILCSTGMSPWSELDAVVERCKRRGASLALMQCTSVYPCPPERVGLNLLDEYRRRYSCPVGLSDHSGTIYPGLAAATLGAEVLEIHVTLSREAFGPDVSSSVTTSELRQLVDGIRFIEKMRSNPVEKDESASVLAPMRSLFTKSLFAARDLPAGIVLSREHVAIKKPGTGIPAAKLDEIVGRRVARAYSSGEQLRIEDLEPS